MYELIPKFTLAMVLAPLIASIIAGVFGKQIGRRGAHIVTIVGVAIAFILAAFLFKWIIFNGIPHYNGNLYTWGISGVFSFNIGFLVDQLSATMMVIVTFVSLLVHIYSIGYMEGDPGYQRFFSYISLFTFAMLMLVSANNFLQLFFGWEGVGLASYLLIGFWFKREPANLGSLKAFLVNRVGDLGFLLGIAAILDYFGTVDYAAVFKVAPYLAHQTIQILPSMQWSVISMICILLFIGAMGKSAQMPLHVWLPESMEGPTPISALIHAATMVTAGVYMVARMSPLFQFSETAQSFVLIVGATGALFTGMLAIVQTDIKRVVAYSTLSQLGYMVVALGASAYAAGILHLVTHAFFKALLFLGAGSVIVAMHHDQDIRHMGNLRKYMPITYITFLIGSLSLSAIPPFAGFYSKDAIIDAAHLTRIFGGTYAYFCVLIGAFVTAFYSFRVFFLVFHTEERMDKHTREHLHEPSWVIVLPLILLAIPAVISGILLVGPALYPSAISLFGQTLFVLPKYNVLAQMAEEYHGVWSSALHAIFTLPFWLAIAGIFTAWVCYIKMPQLPQWFAQRLALIYRILLRKYGFDDFNQVVFANGSRLLANFLYMVTDKKIIDDWFVNGSGRIVQWCSQLARRAQSGYLYHYALAMTLGLLVFLGWLVL